MMRDKEVGKAWHWFIEDPHNSFSRDDVGDLIRKLVEEREEYHRTHGNKVDPLSPTLRDFGISEKDWPT